MTQAQAQAYLCGLSPHQHDPKFFAQHLCAYRFARPYAQGKRVLEIGFGEGYGADALAEVAAEVIAVDLAPGNIPRAAAKYRRPNLHFQLVDGERLQFPDASFDMACSFQVVEHIPEPLLARHCEEVFRLLRPGGLYCLSTLNLAHNKKSGQPYQKLAYHEKEFTAPELEALLRQAFPVVEMRGLHLTWRHRFYQRLKKWGLNRLGPPSLNAIARFYARVTVDDFVVTRDVSAACLDLYALCRKAPT